ncbi:MAG: hypothetical protein AAGN66_16230 [Acidobacteriota bacterium]
MSNPHAQSELVQVTRETEVNDGAVVGGPRKRVYGKGISWEAQGDMEDSPLVTGEGERHDSQPKGRSAKVTVPSVLVYGLNHDELCDWMRVDSFPADVTISGTDLEMVADATHADGSTGPAIVSATAGKFSTLVGLSQGAEQLLLISEAWSTDDNSFPRAIKAVSAQQIDLEPTYVSGVAGEPGAPVQDEAPGADVVLRVGAPVRNGKIQDARSVNFEGEYTDQDGDFQMIRGCKCGSFKFRINGKGAMELEFGYEALDYDTPTATSQGSGEIANSAIDNEMMMGARVKYVLIGGTLNIARKNLTMLEITGDGKAESDDDVVGSESSVAVTLASQSYEGSLDVYHSKVASARLTALGRGREVTTLDVVTEPDAKGNFYVFRCRVRFARALSKPGESGRTKGQFPFRLVRFPNGTRSFIVQAFAGSV